MNRPMEDRCPECKGTKKLVLFTSEEDCPTCSGTGLSPIGLHQLWKIALLGRPQGMGMKSWLRQEMEESWSEEWDRFERQSLGRTQRAALDIIDDDFGEWISFDARRLARPHEYAMSDPEPELLFEEWPRGPGMQEGGIVKPAEDCDECWGTGLYKGMGGPCSQGCMPK